MLKAAAFALSLAACGHPAYADAPRCTSLEKAQKAAGKGTTITAVSRAQFYVLTGMYLRDPQTPEGLPPGDGALILARDDDGAGLILWTRGSLACDPWPIGDAKKLLKLLAEVKRGDGDGL